MSMSPPSPGTVMRDPESSLGHRLVATFGFGVIGAFIIGLIAGPMVAVVLALIGIVVLVLVGKDALQAMVAWHAPQLEVASVPYGLGSTPVVTYHRKPKRPTDISECVVECRLVCEEQVTYTRGTDTSTDTRTVYERSFRGAGEGTAEGLVADIELGISARNGAPSMELPHNKISWSAQFRITGPRLPRDEHTFVIDVGALLDPSHRVGLQDS